MGLVVCHAAESLVVRDAILNMRFNAFFWRVGLPCLFGSFACPAPAPWADCIFFRDLIHFSDIGKIFKSWWPLCRTVSGADSFTALSSCFFNFSRCSAALSTIDDNTPYGTHWLSNNRILLARHSLPSSGLPDIASFLFQELAILFKSIRPD